MSIRRTAASSSGSHGAGGAFWTSLAAWSALVIGLANLAFIMFLWNRLPVKDLEDEAGDLLQRGQAMVEDVADRLPESAPERGGEPAPAVATGTLAGREEPLSPAPPTEAEAQAQAAPEDARPGIRLQVLNGTGVRLVAAQAADGLRRLRYDVRETGNAREPLDKTRIVSRVKDPAPSLRLAQDLGLSSARISYAADPNLVDVDLTLIMGADYRKLPVMGKR
ncbi:MAG: LytR C-terminal domain-containing protein [bacterium]|jgi:hypothetical protein|nr:LytR C-terminal domain-containing protein [bacterium]